jgi:hypothetical protein
MRYLALIYGDESAWEALTEHEREAVYAKYRAFSESGNVNIVGGAEMAPTRSATTVRVREGQTQVSDGPAEDLAAPLGGFFLFECESMDEAVQLAAKIPGAATGFVEVWPAHVEEGES